eukprot:scaffold2004_cov107-Isochrysis_galbana.AAC.3
MAPAGTRFPSCGGGHAEAGRRRQNGSRFASPRRRQIGRGGRGPDTVCGHGSGSSDAMDARDQRQRCRGALRHTCDFRGGDAAIGEAEHASDAGGVGAEREDEEAAAAIQDIAAVLVRSERAGADGRAGRPRAGRHVHLAVGAARDAASHGGREPAPAGDRCRCRRLRQRRPRHPPLPGRDGPQGAVRAARGRAVGRLYVWGAGATAAVGHVADRDVCRRGHHVRGGPGA